jgi:hypothetical protein
VVFDQKLQHGDQPLIEVPLVGYRLDLPIVAFECGGALNPPHSDRPSDRPHRRMTRLTRVLSTIAAQVSAFGTLISKGSVLSAATRISSRRIASETDSLISARTLAAFSLTCPSMRARTTVSEAIEPLRDVSDYNVATHHHSVYPDDLFAGPWLRGSLCSLKGPEAVGRRCPV